MFTLCSSFLGELKELKELKELRQQLCGKSEGNCRRYSALAVPSKRGASLSGTARAPYLLKQLFWRMPSFYLFAFLPFYL